jgi:hypothetical protein
MKHLVLTAIFAVAAVSTSAFAADPADVNLTKSSMNVDFNTMIEGNNHVKKDIQKNIDQSLAEVDTDETSDKSRVLDFVDVEVGWGETSPSNIVDRRFNSIGGPQPVDLNTLMAPDNI